ncbi:MAG: alkaline phosphatase D family protein [Pseudomonadota bacterium]
MQRRQFLQNSLLLGATLPSLVACLGSDDSSDATIQPSPPGGGSTPSAREVDALLAANAFPYGVASGDPDADKIILWTALKPVNADVASIPLRLEYVLSSQRIKNESDWAALFTPAAVRRLGTFLALKARDYTLKIDLGNVALYQGTRFAEGVMAALPAGQFVYYRFVAGSQVSRIGRARTQPAVSAATTANFAVASCSNLPEGFFSVYDMISQEDNLDFVVHLGDYLYEYGEDEYGDGSALVRNGLDRVPEPPTEMITQQDYVLRHAQYKRDPELQRLHAQFPMICVWDDHEFTNDTYRDGAENHTEGAEGTWADRSGFSIRAYFNWMPLREQFSRQANTLRPDPREVIYRRIRVGGLMDLIMLDTRYVGRDKQAATPAVDPDRTNPARSLLGQSQREWLQLQLLLAKNEGAKWTFLGQQVMFGQLNLVELPQLQLLGQKVLGNIAAVNMDQWDGYVAERDRVRDFIKAIGLQNLVVLTGDIHTSWAIELYENPFLLAGNLLEKPFGVELVAPSVTSPGFPDGVAEVVSAAIPVANPHIRYSELKTHGYVLVSLSAERMIAQWRYAANIVDPEQIGVESLAMRKTFAVAAGTSKLTDIADPFA